VIAKRGKNISLNLKRAVINGAEFLDTDLELHVVVRTSRNNFGKDVGCNSLFWNETE
jgi:hypothetical protein